MRFQFFAGVLWWCGERRFWKKCNVNAWRMGSDVNACPITNYNETLPRLKCSLTLDIVSITGEVVYCCYHSVKSRGYPESFIQLKERQWGRRSLKAKRDKCVCVCQLCSPLTWQHCALYLNGVQWVKNPVIWQIVLNTTFIESFSNKIICCSVSNFIEWNVSSNHTHLHFLLKNYYWTHCCGIRYTFFSSANLTTLKMKLLKWQNRFFNSWDKVCLQKSAVFHWPVPSTRRHQVKQEVN